MICNQSSIHEFNFCLYFSRMVEEATNGNSEGPDARTLKMISRAAFEVDDYWRSSIKDLTGG
ncbi:hypothetical protein ACS0TY_016111 [Phlomoides rotata]